MLLWFERKYIIFLKKGQDVYNKWYNTGSGVQICEIPGQNCVWYDANKMTPPGSDDFNLSNDESKAQIHKLRLKTEDL